MIRPSVSKTYDERGVSLDVQFDCPHCPATHVLRDWRDWTWTGVVMVPCSTEPVLLDWELARQKAGKRQPSPTIERNLAREREAAWTMQGGK